MRRRAHHLRVDQAAAVFMVVVTTLATPPLLAWAIRRTIPAAGPHGAPTEAKMVKESG